MLRQVSWRPQETSQEGVRAETKEVVSRILCYGQRGRLLRHCQMWRLLHSADRILTTQFWIAVVHFLELIIVISISKLPAEAIVYWRENVTDHIVAWNWINNCVFSWNGAIMYSQWNQSYVLVKWSNHVFSWNGIYCTFSQMESVGHCKRIPEKLQQNSINFRVFSVDIMLVADLHPWTWCEQWLWLLIVWYTLYRGRSEEVMRQTSCLSFLISPWEYIRRSFLQINYLFPVNYISQNHGSSNV